MVACAVIAYVWLAWLTIRSNAENRVQTIEQATTTEPLILEAVEPEQIPEKAAVKRAVQREEPAQEPAYTPPPVSITNVNIQTAPQQAPQAATAAPQPAAAAAPAFMEPTPKTTLEIATEIVHMYDPKGTAQLVGSDKIQVTAYGGKSVTTDLVDGWEEKLKAVLRKIK